MSNTIANKCRNQAMQEILDWAVEEWMSEVRLRPLANIHRRTLDETWRKVIRRCGGDPDELLGPCHDELVLVSGGVE